MADQLVPIKIKIYPFLVASSFSAAQDIDIKVSCAINIIYLDGQVEWIHIKLPCQ